VIEFGKGISLKDLQPENHPSGDSLIEAGSCILAN
jgi:hypothetical protein